MEHNLVLCSFDIVIYFIFFVVRVSLINNATRFPLRNSGFLQNTTSQRKSFFFSAFLFLARCMYILFKRQRFALVVFGRLLISTQQSVLEQVLSTRAIASLR